MTVNHRSRLCDVVIVGAGLGGSTLAYRLAGHGLRILIIDRGDFLRLPARKPDDPIGLHISNFQSTGSPLLLGGKTKFYGAAMCRLRETDFRSVQHEVGESPAWPITYWDLEPYYSEAERLYRVHGSENTDPTEPPRSSAFPYPPIPHAPLISALIDRLRESGTRVSPIPRSLDYGYGGKCVLCPTCDSYYCRLDAKLDAEIAALRPALLMAGVELLACTKCLRILTNDNGSRAVGVLVERNGEQEVIYAKTVAICAGIPGSAQLFINSSSQRHRYGLGNGNGTVGRYFAGHSTGLIFPVITRDRKLPPLHTKTFCINTYYHGVPEWPYPAGIIQAAGEFPLPAAREISTWVREHCICIFYMAEALPHRESGFHFSGRSITQLMPPHENVHSFNVLRRLAIKAFTEAGYQVEAHDRRYLWHGTGTLCFGRDPNSSVLDSNCRVHDIEQLYVVDASVLPSAGAINTGLTIAALALRLGDIISGFDPHRPYQPSF